MTKKIISIVLDFVFKSSKKLRLAIISSIIIAIVNMEESVKKYER